MLFGDPRAGRVGKTCSRCENEFSGREHDTSLLQPHIKKNNDAGTKELPQLKTGLGPHYVVVQHAH